MLILLCFLCCRCTEINTHSLCACCNYTDSNTHSVVCLFGVAVERLILTLYVLVVTIQILCCVLFVVGVQRITLTSLCPCSLYFVTVERLIHTLCVSVVVTVQRLIIINNYNNHSLVFVVTVQTLTLCCVLVFCSCTEINTHSVASL